MTLTDRLHELDRRQQQSPRLSFIAAVLKKFGDDQAGQLAALIAYYGFVSLFPLLLVLVTVLGFVLQGDPGEQKRILDGALGQFPIIREQLKLESLTGSGAGLAIGAVGSLLAGMGITGATQNAFNRIWSVPFKNRPNFLQARLRGLGMLAILGTMSIVSTTAAGFVGSASHAAPAVAAGIVVAFVFNLALFMTAFKLLTAVEVSWRQLLPGVIVAAVFWQLLQHLGGFYVEHELKRTGPLYGVFRARPRPARLAVPRRPADDLRRRDQRRARAPAVAAQLLLRTPARGRPPRADLLGRGRGARARAERRRQLRGARVTRFRLCKAIPGMTQKYLRKQPPRAILTTLS